MKYIKSFNESKIRYPLDVNRNLTHNRNDYEEYVTDEVMDNLSDCLLEVFDHFSIPMTSDGKFQATLNELRWWNDRNRYITIDCIPYLDSNKLLFDIIQYIRSKKEMISNRLGYDISLDWANDRSWIIIRPLVLIKLFH